MKYIPLKIEAKNSDTEIWLADDEGNLVQKETGAMDTRLLPGNYVVHFGKPTSPGCQFALLEELDGLTITEGLPPK